MATKKDGNSKKDRETFLGDVRSTVENGPVEIRPEELREDFLRTVRAMTDLAEKDTNAEAKVNAARMVDKLYFTVLSKWMLTETVDKVDRTNNRAVNDLRKLRHDNDRKPWDNNSEEDEENE